MKGAAIRCPRHFQRSTPNGEKENAERYQVDIGFMEMDVLQWAHVHCRKMASPWDILFIQ
jgi:hypothetical protein